MLDLLRQFWPHLVGALSVGVAAAATVHILLNKRETRAAIGWAGLVWLAPLLGAGLYALLGVNRIRRRALDLLGDRARFHGRSVCAFHPETLRHPVFLARPDLAALVRCVDNATTRPLVEGNAVRPLVGGTAAYADMLLAIGEARRSVTLATYIFDDDALGRRFAAALGDAVARGVEVRVLVDALGLRYSLPTIRRRLTRLGVRTALFLPASRPWLWPHLNLRNHRKILVVDGRVGFTGGMNIRRGHLSSRKEGGRGRIQDLHFRLEGPVVAHLQEVFAEDWAFAAGERLQGEAWFPEPAPAGPALARGVPDGPDEDMDELDWTIQGALSCARERVRVVTPYFLPEEGLMTALSVAAMRGVDVQIVLPGRSNLPWVHWATMGSIAPLLARGCRVWLTPPPFDHTKALVVDGAWSLVGSANWDERSLRLNFELNVEVYDEALAKSLEALADAKVRTARPLTPEDLEGRRLPAKLRDGAARLFSPYL